MDTLGNTGGDKTKTQYVYFKIIDEHHLILLQLSTPFSNETTYDALQKNIAAFLAGVSFLSKFSFPTNAPIDVADAGVKVAPAAESRWFSFKFFSHITVSYHNLWLIIRIFYPERLSRNLWSYAQISIAPNSFYTEEQQLLNCSIVSKSHHILVKTLNHKILPISDMRDFLSVM